MSQTDRDGFEGRRAGVLLPLRRRLGVGGVLLLHLAPDERSHPRPEPPHVGLGHERRQRVRVPSHHPQQLLDAVVRVLRASQ